MSVLPDVRLEGMMSHDAVIGPASQDVFLGPRLIRLPYGVTLDPEVDQSALWQDVPLRPDGRWCLGQGSLYLGTTQEQILVSDQLVGLLHGISSLGRLGLLVHCTAGLVDPGWTGRLTLELVSLAGSLLLRPGQRIAQISYHELTSSCLHPYRGKYLAGAENPVPSRMYREAVS